MLISAFDAESALCEWAREVIATAVSGDGAAISAVSSAELCVGDADPSTVAARVRGWGVVIVDVPAAAVEPCTRALVRYRERREAADQGRYKTYFSSVTLEMPT